MLVAQWLDHRFDVSSPSAAKVEALGEYERLGGEETVTACR